MVSGILPVKEFPDKRKNCKLAKYPIDAGMDPMKELWSRNRNSRAVQKPISYGIDPVKWLENNFKDFQLAIILSLIYFLFQLPFIRVLLNTYIPMFFFKDGNINIYGNIFMSLIFGLIYYILALLLNL